MLSALALQMVLPVSVTKDMKEMELTVLVCKIIINDNVLCLCKR